MVYDVVGVLGRGGTGVVELAELADGTRVARKRIALHGSARQADIAVRRLRREAEVLAGLRHPNIVRLLDVEEDGESVVLVVPWLEGGNLHDRVALRGPLPPDEVDDLARALLSALAAAHAALHEQQLAATRRARGVTSRVRFPSLVAGEDHGCLRGAGRPLPASWLLRGVPSRRRGGRRRRGWGPPGVIVWTGPP